MNILREVRRVKQKSMPVRLVTILVFSVILIVNTYAWFSAQKSITIDGIEGDVTSWDVAYYINNNTGETVDQIATITINEFYPGMPDREDKVYIYNMGETATNIQYELISVKVFGQEVLSTLQSTGEITTDTATNTTHLFSNDTAYPFNISYTYDKIYLEGNEDYQNYVTEDGYLKTIEKDGEQVSAPYATFRYLVSWDYENYTNDKDGNTILDTARDALDTKFGKDAYKYYNVDAQDPSKAVEIKVRITSSKVESPS